MSKAIKIGNLEIGGGNEIIIQSMTNVKTCNYDAALAQINELYEHDCKIVRLAIMGDDDIKVAKRLIENSRAVLAADIQFDYKLAVAASDIGFKKIRINPGNIGDENKVREVVAACKRNKTAIRVGANSGSIEKTAYQKYGNSAAALAHSAMDNVRILEKFSFYDIVVSAKSSSVPVMIETNRLLAKMTDYPLHLGVTESGTYNTGMIKSAIGIGSLLCDNIGDTIRVSLSCNPIEEVLMARQILRAAGIDKNFCEVISCPTCARCNYNLQDVAQWLENYTKPIKKRLKIAIMGCAVNGPGEAKEADFGIAGGVDKAVIFAKGEIIKTVPFEEIYDELKSYLSERGFMPKQNNYIHQTKN